MYGPDGRCGGCRTTRPLTDALVQEVISHISEPRLKDEAIWASRFVCPTHGRGTSALVRTDKTCAICGEMFYRDPIF